MTKAALLVAALATGCTTQGIAEAPDAPTTPIASSAITTVAGHDVRVATGGALAVTVHDKRAIGLAASASRGYEVSPYEMDRWPHTLSTEYLVRASIAGAGSYEIETSIGIATGLVHSADVARVALVPANYELDGKSPFALSAQRNEVEVALFDLNDRRLVDATLAISGMQTSWDRANLTSGNVTVSADSFGERAFSIQIVDTIDRVESVRVGERTCFHAYAGSTEVVAAMAFDGGTPDPSAQNCVIAPSNVSAVVL